MTGRSLANKFILIVDDDPRMLKALERVFAQEGATVTCAEYAVDAFKILAIRPGRFDLFITDLRLPFVPGEKAIRIVHEIFPELPIVVLTAFGDDEVEAECMRQGAVAFLEKPLDASRLLKALEDIFSGKTGGEKKLNEADSESTKQPEWQ